MPSDVAIIEQIIHELGAESRIDWQHFPLNLDWRQGVLTMQGECKNIIALKLTLEIAAGIPEVSGIVDRLTVTPAVLMGDNEISDHVVKALASDTTFSQCHLCSKVRKKTVIVQNPPESQSRIEVLVADGIVTLDGEVPSLTHKRLAGMMAWWVPGSRLVNNGLGVEPFEQDNDDEISDALRIVLEKDPFIDPQQINIRTHNAVVTLSGLVFSLAELEMAEIDAWSLFGVDQVINQITVGHSNAERLLNP